LKEAGCSSRALKQAGFGVRDLKQAGLEWRELKGLGFKAEACKKAGCPLPKLCEAGFRARDLKEAGFQLLELKKAGFSERDLRYANFARAEHRAAGLEALREASFDARELKDPDFFSEAELLQAGYPPLEIWVSAEDRHFSLQELVAKGWKAQGLKQAGIGLVEQLAGGVEEHEVFGAFEKKDFRAVGLAKLREGGFDPNLLEYHGIFSEAEMLQAGCTLREIRLNTRHRNLSLKQLQAMKRFNGGLMYSDEILRGIT